MGDFKMAGFYSASEYVKTAFIVLVITGVFHVVAFAAPYWTTRPDGNAGLWWGCSEGRCYERFNLWVESWIKAVQTFMTAALIFWAGGVICLFYYIFHRNWEEDKRLVFISNICTFITALFVLLAVLIWAGSEHYGSGEALNWPFAFACACFISYTVCGVFLYLEMKIQAEEEDKEDEYYPY